MENAAIDLWCIQKLAFAIPILFSDWHPFPWHLICSFMRTQRLGVVRLGGSCKANNRQSDGCNLFVVSVYAPTDCSPNEIKHTFYQKLGEPLRTATRGDMVILSGAINARLGRLSSDPMHLGSPFGLKSCRSENEERLLALCSDYPLFLASTRFRRFNRRYGTLCRSSSSERWTQIHHFAITHRWWGCQQDCRSYWNTRLDSNHSWIYARPSIWFGSCSKPVIQRRLHCDKLSESIRSSIFQSILTWKLRFPRLTTSMSICCLSRMHCILLAWCVLVWLVALWHPAFLLSLWALIMHTSPSRLVVCIMKHGS